MTSKNILLGSGKLEAIIEADENIISPIVDADAVVPCWRFSEECPEGRLIKTASELANLEGVWYDHPGKVRRLPGMEDIYDAEHGG